MDATTRGSLEWPFENELRWVAGTFGASPPHRIMIHAGVGLVFDAHAYSNAELVALEAKMTNVGDFCACHVLALWLQGFLEWDRAYVRPDETSPELRVMRVALRRKEEEVFCLLTGQGIDMTLFSRLVHAVVPKPNISWFKNPEMTKR